MKPPRTPSRRFVAVLAANGVLALLLFATGVVGFLTITLELQNGFAAYARQHMLGEALAANLRTLPAYALLAVLYALLGYPLLRRSRTLARGGRLRVMGAVGVLNAGLFILSLGITGLLAPAFLDAVARLVARVAPELDLYWLKRWHVFTVLAGLMGLVVLHAARIYLAPAVRAFVRLRWGPAAALLLAGGGTVAALGAGGEPSSHPAPERPNILILASDSLRADRLSCYGHHRRTSPHVDALAEQGVLLENLHVATASTLESWLSILSSRFPVTHGVRYMFIDQETAARASGIPDTLPRVLRSQGYHTAVSSNWAGNCFSLVDMGFDADRASKPQTMKVFLAEATLIAHLVFPFYFNNALGELLYPEIRQITSYLNPDTLVARLEEEMDAARRRGRPFFGLLFTSHTHLPYAASHPFNVMWADPGYRGPHRYEIEVDFDRFISRGFTGDLPPEQVQHIRDLYDGCVSEFDHTVGRILGMLERKGLSGNTIVIVTSDHGEDLYEPRTTLGHGINFFGGDQSTRIPFVMRLPDRRFQGVRVPQITRSVDLAPTLLDLLDLPVPGAWEGVSLLPALRSPDRPLHLPAFAETCYLFHPKHMHGEGVLTVHPADKSSYVDPDFDHNFVLKERYREEVIATKDRMVRAGRWKLVLIPGVDGPILQLYDMHTDPGQEHDLATERPEVTRRLAHLLRAWWRGETGLRWTVRGAPERR